jgi:radical SAM superfamily enzyme YgiQ (UPF0313 family)
MKPMSAAMKPSPSLGLAFIAGALSREGHEIQIIDALAEAPNQYVGFKDDIVLNGWNEVQIAEAIDSETQVIGLSLMFSGNWLHNRILIDYLRNQFPNVLIVAGGEHLTAVPEFCIEQTMGLDICVSGEGEQTIIDVVHAFEHNEPFDLIPGIVFRNEKNQAQRTTFKTRIKDVEEIARPAWEFFPLEKYRENSIIYGVDRNVNSVPLMATRGCPYRCTFCSSPLMWGTKYYMRSPKDVADEIEEFIERFDIGNFDFYDLTAIIKKDWIIEFAKEIINRNLNITWQIPAGTRSEAIDQEVAKYLYLSGCTNITYAPESGSVSVLKAIKKKVSLPAMLRSIQYSNKEKMNIKINVIIGFPDETHKDIWATIRFLIKASWYGAHDMSPSVFSPYPGSELFNRLLADGKIEMENDAYFYQIIYVDTFFNNHFYNNHISKFQLRLYHLSYLLVFYSTNFLFHPARAFRTIKNLITGNYESRAETALGELVKRSKIKVFTSLEELRKDQNNTAFNQNF